MIDLMKLSYSLLTRLLLPLLLCACLAMSKSMAGVTYTPLNPGPLSLDVVNTFRSGTYTEMVAQQPITLYRVYGGIAKPIGSYWTQTPPTGPLQSIIDSALLPEWGNTASSVVKIEIPVGTKYYTGVAARQGGLVGGGNQVVFHPDFKIDPSWIKTP
jgi:filamentous hemagglutinin